MTFFDSAPVRWWIASGADVVARRLVADHAHDRPRSPGRRRRRSRPQQRARCPASRRAASRRRSRSAGTRRCAARRRRRSTSADGCRRRSSGLGLGDGSLIDVLFLLGAREAGDPRAQLVGLRRGSSGIVWLPAAVWTTTVESPNACSKSPRRVSTCCTRTHGTSVRLIVSVAVLDVDPLVVDVPAPARPAQPRDATVAARSRARAAADPRQRRRPSDVERDDHGRDGQRRPRREQLLQHARPAGRRGRACATGVAHRRARRRAARSGRARARTRRRTGACVIGASVAASSRRRCARCAFTRSCAASAARTAPSAVRRVPVARGGAQLGHVVRRRSARATSRSSRSRRGRARPRRAAAARARSSR